MMSDREHLECLKLCAKHFDRCHMPGSAETCREAIRRLTPAPVPEGSVEARIAVGHVDGHWFVSPGNVRGVEAAESDVRANAASWGLKIQNLCIARVVVPPVAAVPVVRGEVTG